MALSASVLQAAELEEYQVKAGFLLNFIKLSSFSESEQIIADNNKIDVCISELGSDEKYFMALGGRELKDRTVEVHENFTPDCEVGFLSEGANASERRAFFEMTKKGSFLGVVESEDDFSKGGILLLTRSQSRVGFAVSMKRLKKSEVKLSSQLLRLADIRE